MTEFWEWLDGMGWEVLIIWSVAAVILGLVVGRFISEANPSDEEPL
jgi:hypothetical protein